MTYTTDIGSLSFAYLIEQYRRGLALKYVMETISDSIVAHGDDGIWTHVLSKDALLRRAAELEAIEPAFRKKFPLWGIPFSVKDCIDVANLPTSCACPGFSYVAAKTNPAVQKLLNAGAILIGKTNLDQFATGLVGIRTGFSIPQNSFVEGYIPGGSSSGAALSVAVGLVSFAIGTDTGGSGRVPAGFNNIIGLKPTRGLLNAAHIVDACKTIDCISIFALTADDALKVMQVAEDPDNLFRDEVSPKILNTYHEGQAFRFGVPKANQLKFFGNAEAEALFAQAIERLMVMGGRSIEIDYEPFLEVNKLLFNGPWLAERYASVGSFIEANLDRVLPITREIILAAKAFTAVDVFKGLYRLTALKREVRSLWEQIDVFVVPTTGTAYRIDEVESSPIALNANLGYYTNFVNLLDLAALAVPNGFQSNSMPAGVTLIAPPYSETYLTGLGSAFHRYRVNRLGATPFSFADLKTLPAR